MQNLYTILARSEVSEERLTEAEIFSVFYHDLFDYPLNFSDLIRWTSGEQFPTTNFSTPIIKKNGYLFLEGKAGIVYKRMLRKRISAKKLEIAKRASKILSFLPSIKMIAITGSLAMENSSDESDIDLMIVTKSGSLWTTRAFAYLLICLFGIQTRKPTDKQQKDKLCLNMWLDEGDLKWPQNDRNVYTAHEIGQIRPLVNKNKTYEKFLYRNKWILGFWPNAVRVTELQRDRETKSGFFASVTLFLCNLLTSLVEKIAYKFQRVYMQKKVTRELITPTRALFHPQDWGKVVLERMMV